MAFFKNLKMSLQNSFPIFKRRKRSSSLPGDYDSEAHRATEERPRVGTAPPQQQQHLRSASVDRGSSRIAASISLRKVGGTAAAPTAGAAAAGAAAIVGPAGHEPEVRSPSLSSPSFRSDRSLDTNALASATQEADLSKETADGQNLAAKATSPLEESKYMSLSSPEILSSSHTPDILLVSKKHVKKERKQNPPSSPETSESSLDRLIEQYVNKLIVSHDWSDTKKPQIAGRHDQLVFNIRSPDISGSQNEVCPQDDLGKSSGSSKSKEDTKIVSRSSQPWTWLDSPNKDFKLSRTSPDLSTDRDSPAMTRRQAGSPEVPVERRGSVQDGSLERFYRNFPPVEATALSRPNRPDLPHQPSLLLMGSGRYRSPIRTPTVEGHGPTLQQMARSPVRLSREVGSQLWHSGFRPIVLGSIVPADPAASPPRQERDGDAGRVVAAAAPLRVSGTRGEKLKMKRKAKNVQAAVHASQATQVLDSDMDLDSAAETEAVGLAGSGKIRSSPLGSCGSSSPDAAAPKTSQAAAAAAAVQTSVAPSLTLDGIEEKEEREGQWGPQIGLMGRKAASTTSCLFSISSDTPSSSEGMVTGRVKDAEEDAAYPSTSRQVGGSSEAARSPPFADPWLEEQMEEMVVTLKTKSSYTKKRSRSRSRRSRPRQNCEAGMTVSHVSHARLLQAFPLRLRETDSDDSNTSLGPPPAPPFFCTLLGGQGGLRGPPHLALNHVPGPTSAFVTGTTRRFNQSNSSFHSALQSDEALTPQTSTAADLPLRPQRSQPSGAEGKDAEEHEQQQQQDATRTRAGGAGQIEEEEEQQDEAENEEEATARALVLREAQLAAYHRRVQEEGHNLPATPPTGVPLGMVVQELGSYGPEEFVLDLFLTLCRGTWSDML